MTFAEIISLAIGAILVNNVLLSQFLGICSFVGVSKKKSSSLGMGLAVLFVLVMSSLVTWLLYNLVLVPLNIEFLSTIVFILVIATLVQFCEMVIKKYMPALYKVLGIYLPLITTNCAVLGVAELVIDSAQIASLIGIESSAMNMGFAVLYGLFAGLGFTLAIVLMSGMREKIAKLPINKHLKGFPIAMIAACFIAMAFYVFALI